MPIDLMSNGEFLHSGDPLDNGVFGQQWSHLFKRKVSTKTRWFGKYFKMMVYLVVTDAISEQGSYSMDVFQCETKEFAHGNAHSLAKFESEHS